MLSWWFWLLCRMVFFATAHSKRPCDGLAGTIKRLAQRASLQIGKRQQILTPLALFEWALQSLPKIDFVFLFLKNSIFFKKLRLFTSWDTSWHFFQVHNPNKKWLEISVSENSIIRWVYKVVKKGLRKIWNNSRSVLLGDSKYSRSGSQIKEGEVQMVVNNWRNHPCTKIPNESIPRSLQKVVKSSKSPIN